MSRSTLSRPPLNRSIPTARSGPRHGDPGSADLTHDEIAVLRAMLEQQRAFRVEQLADLSRPDSPGPLGSAEHEVLTSLRNGARIALREVQRALWRMDEGRYGRCTSCNARIETQRLEILPQVALCLSCQRVVATA